MRLALVWIPTLGKDLLSPSSSRTKKSKLLKTKKRSKTRRVSKTITRRRKKYKLERNRRGR